MNNDGMMKVLFLLLAVGILSSVSSQIYTSVTEKYKTETAQIANSADRISFRGIYIRNESTIRQVTNGVLSYPVTDGSKVGNGSVVAYVYDSEDDIDLNQQINALNSEIKLLESAQNPGTTLTAQPKFISDLIDEKYQMVTTQLAKKDVKDISSLGNELLTLMSIYQIAVNQEEGYDDRITMLASTVADLKSRVNPPKDTVVSPDAGYFVSYTDGYESILRTDNNSNITANRIKQIIDDEKKHSTDRDKTAIGKLIDGYDWKIAGIIDNSQHVYNPGDEVTLSFASTPDKVRAVIESLEETENPNEWVLILRCDEMTYDLVQKRVERVEMVLHDFEGIKVPRSAIRFNKNNEKGVYVLWGQRVLFKKVDIIFESDDYILSRITSDESYVCVYDDMIIRGVDTADFMANSDEVVVSDEDDDEDEFVRYTSAEAGEETAAETEDITASEESGDNAGDDSDEETEPTAEGAVTFE
ncbi:MAG: HlyD family efflux transporter periplasmic adaptor subunit [Huintestinicola sp.]